MNNSLSKLGLSAFFTQQLSLEEMESYELARITEVQRNGVLARTGENSWFITLSNNWFQLLPEQRPTVGDWVLLDASHEKITRLLERKSIFKRVAAGDKVDVQLIAANVDTLLIVTSCNDDFNESRLERYLALATEAGVDPVIVITKSDLTEDPDSFRLRAMKIKAGLPVELVNARDVESLLAIDEWITPGVTVALVGSSGVGKSTIVNSLSGKQLTKTSSIREQDAKGRHTTSYRALHELTTGGVLLDVPGMRELKVAQLEESLASVFSDIEKLAQHCKFTDCAHMDEPGCVVQQAIENGEMDERRLTNFQNLQREEARNTASLAENRNRDRQFGKAIRQSIDLKRQRGTRQD
jgi:ribosome biogenesis GTPase